jgi:hypothetical protein
LPHASIPSQFWKGPGSWNMPVLLEVRPKMGIKRQKLGGGGGPNKMHRLPLCEDVLGKCFKCPGLLSRFHQTSPLHTCKTSFIFVELHIRFPLLSGLINSTPSDSPAFLMIKVVGFLKRPPISTSSAPIRADKGRVKITQ